MTTEKAVVLEEVSPAEAARGLGARGLGLGPEGAGEERPGKTAWEPATNREKLAREEAGQREIERRLEALGRDPEPEGRRRRYPISFRPDGEGWVAAQTALFDLEPLRLVVCEPSEDAVLSLHFRTAEFLFRQWRLGAEQTVHSKELHSWGNPDDPDVWKPGELARIEMLAGTISGAAFVARKAGSQ